MDVKITTPKVDTKIPKPASVSKPPKAPKAPKAPALKVRQLGGSFQKAPKMESITKVSGIALRLPSFFDELEKIARSSNMSAPERAFTPERMTRNPRPRNQSMALSPKSRLQDQEAKLREMAKKRKDGPSYSLLRSIAGGASSAYNKIRKGARSASDSLQDAMSGNERVKNSPWGKVREGEKTFIDTKSGKVLARGEGSVKSREALKQLSGRAHKGIKKAKDSISGSLKRAKDAHIAATTKVVPTSLRNPPSIEAARKNPPKVSVKPKVVRPAKGSFLGGGSPKKEK